MKRILTLVLLLFVLSVHILPISYVFVHLEHVCQETNCEVCLDIASVFNNSFNKFKNIFIIKSSLLVNILFTCFLFFTIKKYFYFVSHTPINLKVKLTI